MRCIILTSPLRLAWSLAQRKDLASNFVGHSWKRKSAVSFRCVEINTNFISGCTELALIDLKGEQAKKSAAKIRNHYRTSQTLQHSLAASIEHSSAEKTGLEGNQREIKVEGFECNVAEETSVKDVFEEVIRTFGKLDSVIASAGKRSPVTLFSRSLSI